MSERRFIPVPRELFESWIAGDIGDKEFAAMIVPQEALNAADLKALISNPLPDAARKPRLSKRHKTVLLAMAEYDRAEQVSPFKNLAADTGIELNLVRLAARALARRGFAKLTRGLITVDGELCGGSGYCLTQSGRDLVKMIGGVE